MSLNPIPPLRSDDLYPESDGKPMADNTLQFQWIVTLVGGLQRLYANDKNVFVAGDLLWYPLENHNISAAPDAMVVFGRPQGHRRSYKQWEEDNIAPQVTFEVLSPSNTVTEMNSKLKFYQDYGVEEYFLYDPDGGILEGWTRLGSKLRKVDNIQGWKSPLLQITFALDGKDLCLTDAEGRRFVSYAELAKQQAEAEQQVQEEAKARQLAEQQVQEEAKARQLAEQQVQEEAKARQLAEQRTQEEAKARQLAEAKLARLEALLQEKKIRE